MCVCVCVCVGVCISVVAKEALTLRRDRDNTGNYIAQHKFTTPIFEGVSFTNRSFESILRITIWRR